MAILLPDSLAGVLTLLEHELRPLRGQYLLGGSCGLLLQGVPIANDPRDLDLYSDEASTDEIHACLKNYAIDQVVFSETDIYRSWLSHYDICAMRVELVGGFCVQAQESIYQVDIRKLYPYAQNYAISAEASIRLMPLAHEFIFNILRKREDRYEAIATAMTNDPSAHTDAMSAILLDHTFSERHREMIYQLLPFLTAQEGKTHG